MKYALIIGASENGKSTTINEVCQRLEPSRAWELNSEGIFIEVEATVGMFNGTYLIEVNGTIILVAAGSPTEQDITITVLVQIAINLKFDVKILIVAMRTFEKKEGFDTPNELDKLATKIFQEKISKIHGDYKNSVEWNKRVDTIVLKVKENIVA